MNLSVERKSPTVVEMNIEVESGRVNQAVQQAYKHLVKSLNIPGFRRGKAPMSVLERYIGRDAILTKAREDLVQSSYADAIKEQGLEPLRPGQVDAGELTPGQPYSFLAQVIVRPEIHLGDYRAIVVEEAGVSVTDEDVEARLTRIRRERAQMETVEEATGDSVVVVDMHTECDGITLEKSPGFRIDLTAEFQVVGLKEALVGSRVDDVREVSWVMGEEGPRPGQEARTILRVLQIQQPILPEADDQFSQSVQAGWTVQELRAALENQVLREKMQQAQEERQDRVLAQVVGQVDVETPDAMIEDYMDEAVRSLQQELLQQGVEWDHYLRLTGKTMEEIREQQFREAAADKAREDLVLDAVARAEGLEPSNVEIALVYQQALAASGRKVSRKKGQKADLDQELWYRVVTDLRRIKTARYLSDVTRPNQKTSPEPVAEPAVAPDGSPA